MAEQKEHYLFAVKMEESFNFRKGSIHIVGLKESYINHNYKRVVFNYKGETKEYTPYSRKEAYDFLNSEFETLGLQFRSKDTMGLYKAIRRCVGYNKVRMPF